MFLILSVNVYASYKILPIFNGLPPHFVSSLLLILITLLLSPSHKYLKLEVYKFCSYHSGFTSLLFMLCKLFLCNTTFVGENFFYVFRCKRIIYFYIDKSEAAKVKIKRWKRWYFLITFLKFIYFVTKTCNHPSIIWMIRTTFIPAKRNSFINDIKLAVLILTMSVQWNLFPIWMNWGYIQVIGDRL